MALRFTVPLAARALVRPSNAEALVFPSSSLSLLNKREFHSSQHLDRMAVKGQGMAVRQSIRQFVPEIGVVAQPNEPPSDWGTMEKWKDFVMTPWRWSRNWYIGYVFVLFCFVFVLFFVFFFVFCFLFFVFLFFVFCFSFGRFLIKEIFRYTIRKDGVGKLKNFHVKDFKTFVPEAYVTYNKVCN